MEERLLKKLFWNESATSGLFIGIVLVVLTIVDYYVNFAQTSKFIPSVLQFMILTGSIYFFAKKYAILRGDAGLKYGSAMGFIIVMMGFAGILNGISSYVMINYIDPQYYMDITEKAYIDAGASQEMIDASMVLYEKTMGNAFVSIFGGILGTAFMGGFIGLVIASFIKKEPVIFTDKDAE